VKYKILPSAISIWIYSYGKDEKLRFRIILHCVMLGKWKFWILMDFALRNKGKMGIEMR
jgi:hypothetical protein